MFNQRGEHSGSLFHHNTLSGHVVVHLIPAYRQELKLCKHVVWKFNKLTSEALEDLQAFLDYRDWDVFRTATNCYVLVTKTWTQKQHSQTLLKFETPKKGFINPKSDSVLVLELWTSSGEKG